MKRTLLSKEQYFLPSRLIGELSGYDIYDSSCSREARVYFIDKCEGLFLKRAPLGTLKKEAELTSFFHKKGLSCEVIDYFSEGSYDFFLTKRVLGEDLTHAEYLKRPEWLATKLGELMRSLHDESGIDCPNKARMHEYVETVTSNYKNNLFDPSFAQSKISRDEAYAYFCEGAPLLKEDTLIHGDFCLPNIILCGDELSGYIDLGNAGLGDRHVDLFWGAWTLNFNLGTDKYRQRFFDSYGKDRIDVEKIRLIGIAECFG